MNPVPSQSELVISRVERLDAARLEQLEEYGRAALGDSALDRWMLPVIASFGFLFVAEAGGETVGAAEIINTLDEGELYLEGIYVRPEHQGRGLGTRLLAGVCGRLAQEGHRRLVATVAKENAAGRSLYKRTGFREIGYLPAHYGPGRDRILLALELQGA